MLHCRLSLWNGRFVSSKKFLGAIKDSSDTNAFANIADPDQTILIGALWYRSALFGILIRHFISV